MELGGLRDDLIIGAVLIAVVLFAFMGSMRTVLISFVSIPISLLTALVVMDLFGQTHAVGRRVDSGPTR